MTGVFVEKQCNATSPVMGADLMQQFLKLHRSLALADYRDTAARVDIEHDRNNPACVIARDSDRCLFSPARPRQTQWREE